MKKTLKAKKQVSWKEMMLLVGENLAVRTGMRLQPKVHLKIQRSSKKLKRPDEMSLSNEHIYETNANWQVDTERLAGLE